MRLLSFFVLALAFVFSSPAEARKHHHVRHVATTAYTHADPGCNIIFPCEGVVRNKHGDDFANRAKFGAGVPRYYHHSSAARPRVQVAHSEPAPRRVRRAARVASSYGAPDIPVVSTVRRAANAVGEVIARPRECYGIQWCGCFMRHYKGLTSNRNLNLAREWASVGSKTSPHVGAIVVWRHHVGVLQSEIDGRGRALVLSGNNGSGNVATVRPAYVKNAIAFRQL